MFLAIKIEDFTYIYQQNFLRLSLPSEKQFKPCFISLWLFQYFLHVNDTWTIKVLKSFDKCSSSSWSDTWHFMEVREVFCVCIYIAKRPCLALICIVFFSLNLTLHRLVISLRGAFLVNILHSIAEDTCRWACVQAIGWRYWTIAESKTKRTKSTNTEILFSWFSECIGTR